MDKNSVTRHHDWVDESFAALNPSEGWQPDVSHGLARFRQSQVRESWFGKRWVLAMAGAVAVCFCLMAIPSPKVLAHRCLECFVAAWQSLLPSAPVHADLKSASERSVAPDFSLKDANGKDVKLSDLKGKVVLVNFWATWCHGCQLEIPWYVEFQKQYSDQGLVVVGISMDGDGWKSVRPWLKQKKVNYPIVIGSEGLANQYGLDGMPLTALVDREGRIADVRHGVVEKSATQEKIRDLLQESFKKPTN
jgi:peroxiredoxin